MHQDDELRTLRVASGPFQRAGQLDAFREIFGRAILRLEIDPLGEQPLDIDLTLRALPGFATSSGPFSPLRTRHPSELVDDDDLVLVLVQTGFGELDQRGRTVTLREGEAVLTANGYAGTFTFPVPGRVVNFRLARNRLAPHVADIDDLVARPIPRDDRTLRLLAGYAGVLDDQAELATAELRHLVTTHIYDMVAVLLGSRSGLAVHGQGLRAARLRAIKQAVLGEIGHHHGLSINDVARRLRISQSYIRQLFAEEGTTFTAFVLDQRLLRAHQMLTGARYRNASISSIALEAGFNDLSYFNRTFRRHYGASPSDVREQARRDGGW